MDFASIIYIAAYKFGLFFFGHLFANICTNLSWFNNTFIALPAAILYLGSAIILTIKTGFLQIRAFPQFIKMVASGLGFGASNSINKKSDKKTNAQDATQQTINPFRALFVSLGTTIGMGNVVGPSIAIQLGGPGALVWLLIYMFFASVTKFAEVTFALATREQTPDGYVIGGPMQYLLKVHRYLAYWYGYIMAIVFVGWSGAQANTLAKIISFECAKSVGCSINPNPSLFSIDALPAWIVGITLSFLSWMALRGGVKRISAIATKLVPIMCIGYLSFALYLLTKNPSALKDALILIWNTMFNGKALMGSVAGASIWNAMRYGVFRAVHISEAGMGTSSISHAMSDTKNPTDQGILAMGSMAADIILSSISGLLVLVLMSPTELQAGGFRATLIYELFRDNAPFLGKIILLMSLCLFVLTTVMGNSFNGRQSFASLTRHRWVSQYTFITLLVIVWGALMPSRLVWELMDTLMVCAAVPNILGILYLAFRYPEVLRVSKKP